MVITGPYPSIHLATVRNWLFTVSIKRDDDLNVKALLERRQVVPLKSPRGGRRW